ncbi:MAG: hypothetical protein JWO09_1723 [Bacteroidetes bacterium]|nr:hypothetical protein [Bacteroidota bacterium]
MKHTLSYKLKLAFGVLLLAGTVRSVAQPLVANAGLSTTICSGSSASLGGSPSASYGSAPYTYSWAPATGLSSATVSNPTATPGTNVTYTLTVTDAVSAVATSTVTVTVNPTPIIVVNSPSVCAGMSASLTATGGSGYFWSPGTYLSSVSTASPTCITPAATITYTVSGTAGGCTGTALSTVTVDPVPSPYAGSDQTVCTGDPVTFSASGGGGTTYSWDFGDGVNSTLLSPTHTYVVPGTYTATLTSATGAGCSGTDNVIITVNPNPVITITSVTNASCNGVCDGSMTAAGSGVPGPFSYAWAPSGIFAAVAPSLCGGITYTVTVTSPTGCSSTQVASITEPPAIMVNAGPDQNVCTGSTTTLNGFATGGTAPYTFNWNDGSSNYPGQNLTASPVSGTSYTFTATDASGCVAADYASVSILPLTDFYGHVSYSGGSLSSGTNPVVLYQFNAATNGFDTAMVSTTDASGNFHFASVGSNNYIVKAFNDTAAYPLLIPTYYGGAYVWDSATVRVHDCTATDTTDIVMLEVPLLSGPGHVDGAVLEGSGFVRIPGDPVPGVDIKLGRNPGGQLVASGQTDASGTYSFDNLPVNLAGENYRLYVDIPGLDRVSTYDFVVSGTGITQYFDLDFEADSNSVYTTQTAIGINTPTEKENAMKVYPNPAKENVTVDYTLAADAKVSLEVYNMLGLKVAAPFSNRQSAAGSYNYTINTANYNLKPGVYFMSLRVDGKTTVQRAVITE